MNYSSQEKSMENEMRSALSITLISKIMLRNKDDRHLQWFSCENNFPLNLKIITASCAKIEVLYVMTRTNV